MRFCRYGSGLLAFDNGNPVGIEEISVMLKMSERSVYHAIQNLVQKKILSKVKSGNDNKYYANPWLFCKEKRGNQDKSD